MRFPDYKFEKGFSEVDELFTGETIESASAQALRMKGFWMKFLRMMGVWSCRLLRTESILIRC